VQRSARLVGWLVFSLQGDPVNVYPFVEAEKAEQGGNVAMGGVPHAV